jgi:hypothetical protein
VYVWVSGFASEGDGPEQASATADGASVGTDENDIDWIRVSLTRGENAPYDESQVTYTVLDPNGNSRTVSDGGSADDFLCTAATIDSTGDPEHCADADEFYDDDTATDTNTWDVGEVLYVPCQAEGDHSITISIKGTTVLDTNVDCDANADDK